jgi:hypothetical protein
MLKANTVRVARSSSASSRSRSRCSRTSGGVGERLQARGQNTVSTRQWGVSTHMHVIVAAAQEDTDSSSRRMTTGAGKLLQGVVTQAGTPTVLAPACPCPCLCRGPCLCPCCTCPCRPARGPCHGPCLCGGPAHPCTHSSRGSEASRGRRPADVNSCNLWQARHARLCCCVRMLIHRHTRKQQQHTCGSSSVCRAPSRMHQPP